ncbi:MAG: septum formation initiator family protein [Deltaproteobacteria bacterium]|nr:septum formation initiator family protein [Deltaproteobacteria bacterium]
METPPTSPKGAETKTAASTQGWRGRFGALLTGNLRTGALVEELPRIFPLFLFLFGAGMILISLVGDQGLIAYYHLQQERDRLREEVTHLELRERKLRQEIHALTSSRSYIETLARRRLGLVRPGEIVIQLPPRETP